MFYKAVLAVILLYKSKSWVLTLSGLRLLEGFHLEAARRLTGIHSQRRTVGPWIYPKPKDVLRAVRRRTVGDFIALRRHNIAKTIELRILLEECRKKRKRGSPPCQFWWEQVMELEEEDGDEGFFLSWGNGRGSNEHGAEERCEPAGPPRTLR
jgi:hypothetical protein